MARAEGGREEPACPGSSVAPRPGLPVGTHVDPTQTRPAPLIRPSREGTGEPDPEAPLSTRREPRERITGTALGRSAVSRRRCWHRHPEATVWRALSPGRSVRSAGGGAGRDGTLFTQCAVRSSWGPFRAPRVQLPRQLQLSRGCAPVGEMQVGCWGEQPASPRQARPPPLGTASAPGGVYGGSGA